MPPNRLPIVDGDDSIWGDILNQFIEKEHYNTGSDDVANGGHKTITIRPGTTTAGTAPLKFSSGSLLTSPETGAMEFLTNQLYFTVTTGAVRKTIAMYDDGSGASGDMYYRDSSGNLIRIPIGSNGNVLQVASGLPAWGTLSLTKSDVGLGNVDNTSDINKPLSNASKNALYKKTNNRYFPQLRGWNAGVAGRTTTPARVVLFGDSITQLNAPKIASRLNSNYNGAADSIFLPPGYTGWGQWTTWTGTIGADGSVYAHGLGARGGTLANSQEGTLTKNCDGFILAYTVQKTGGADLNIYIDNVLQTTINTTDGSITPSLESGRLWTSSPLTYGSHTLKVTRSGTGTVLVDGALYTRTNLASGVQVWNAGHIGWRCADFLADEGTFQAIKTLAPSLITIHLGTNDHSTGLATFQTNLTSIVQRVKADAPLASILLIAPHESFDRPDWPDFIQVIKDIAISENTAFLDTYEAMGDLGGAGDVYDLSTDNVHPNTKGGNLMASAIVSALTLPSIDNETPYLKADGSVPLVGSMVLDLGSNGSLGFGSVFGYPTFLGYRVGGEANPEFGMYSGGLASFLGFPSYTIMLGPGGGAATDISLFRSAASELTIGGTTASTLGNIKTELLRKNAGSPESAVTAPVGALAHDTTNGKLYVKNSGSGNTGWQIVASGANMPSGAVVGTTDTQTLTNKTLTSPTITTPSGLTKSDVGLSNVDNTSDADKPLSNQAVTALAAIAAPREILHAGAITQTVPRWIATGNLSLLTSGTLQLVAVSLRQWETVTSITFCSRSTALAGGSNQWFGLFNASRVCLAVTNDAGAAAWGVNTFKTLNLTVPYAIPTTGVYYIGIMINATTVPTLCGMGNATAILSQGTPGLYGNSSTGQTTPFTVGNTAAALANTGLGIPYAYVS